MTVDPFSLVLGMGMGVVIGGALDHWVYPIAFRITAALSRRRPRNGR